ncbi:hypothetical protein C8Q77DRAFT_1150109 [Trametes polyzona]|nr:hypothetical protein C8Q77DRAFT_1150109 [Trametes polyzona]
MMCECSGYPSQWDTHRVKSAYRHSIHHMRVINTRQGYSRRLSCLYHGWPRQHPPDIRTTG